jgi:hypothetical protein
MWGVSQASGTQMSKGPNIVSCPDGFKNWCKVNSYLIIYHIATNYIFSFDKENKISRRHFKHVDTRPAVKEGRLKELLDETFTDPDK